jgi:hypothetical protein
MSHICANDEYRSQVEATTRPENIVIRYISFVSLSRLFMFWNLKVIDVFAPLHRYFQGHSPWEHPTPLVSFRVFFVLCSYDRRNCTFYRCAENFTNHFQFFTRFVQCGSRRFSVDVILCYGRFSILIKDFQFYSNPCGNYYSAAVKKMISWNSTGHCYYSSEF